VVDGAAAALQATSGTTVPDQALRLAEEVALALKADLVAIIIALGPAGPVVWDARPVPSFRDAMPIADLTVAQTISQAVTRRLVTPGLPANRDPAWTGVSTRAQRLGLRRDLVISA
jgi:hypothetical protein